MGRRKTVTGEPANLPERQGWSFALDDELLSDRSPAQVAPEVTAAAAAEPAGAALVLQPLRLSATSRAGAAAPTTGAPVMVNKTVVAQGQFARAPRAAAPRIAEPAPQTVQTVASGIAQGGVSRLPSRPVGVPQQRPAALSAIEGTSGQWPGRAFTGALGIFDGDTMVFKGDAETG